MRQLLVHLAFFAVMFSATALQAQTIGNTVSPVLDRSGAGAANRAAAQSSGQQAEGNYAPRPAWIPAWAEQGNFHFMRLDGGPIEVQKASRALWGKDFTSADQEVLGNMYGKYSAHAIDLLSQGGVNWVWLTWSVGFSWQDEAAQRQLAKEMVSRLHQRGFHVTAYMCSSSIFWQSMFRDQPSRLAG